MRPYLLSACNGEQARLQTIACTTGTSSLQRQQTSETSRITTTTRHKGNRAHATTTKGHVILAQRSVPLKLPRPLQQATTYGGYLRTTSTVCLICIRAIASSAWTSEVRPSLHSPLAGQTATAHLLTHTTCTRHRHPATLSRALCQAPKSTNSLKQLRCLCAEPCLASRAEPPGQPRTPHAASGRHYSSHQTAHRQRRYYPRR